MPLRCFCHDIIQLCSLDFFWACGLKYLPSQFLVLLLPLVHFFTAQHSCWTSLHNILGFPGPSYSLGILGPFHSFLLFFTFPWALTKSFELPWPSWHILFLWVYWHSNQSHLLIPFFRLLQPILFAFFLFLMISMSLLLHSLELPWPVCFLWSQFVIL